MPLFDFKCPDCEHVDEHFVYPQSGTQKVCPKCTSADYKKLPSRFATDVTYADTAEHIANKIDPSVNETYSRIGREALDGDTKTLDNYFGSEKVKSTLDYDV